ncbi:MFS transporter [Pseudonocardia phyllosphaerae]|uniref:MFS transporter n=1 Tax=Pseudonocardia phyllosphaerae TaxID=3390502 RepID=UPI003978A699
MTPTGSPTLPTSPTAPAGYGRLLRTPGARGFVLPGFLARQPFAMLTISIVLLVRHTTGSYGAAGATAAVAGTSVALFSPWIGRLADRHGQRAVLLPDVAVHVVAALGLTALATAGAPLWALLAAAVPAGATAPQIGPMVRARWSALLGDGPLGQTAVAFESVTDELSFVLGPLLATLLCTSLDPAAGLVAEALLVLVGGLLFAAQRGTEPPRAERTAATPAGSAWAVPGVRVLVVAFLGVGSVFGGMQVALAAYSESIGAPGLNGVFYGVFAAGNMTAALIMGAVTWRSPPRRRLLAGYTALAATASLTWFVSLPGFAAWPPLVGAAGLPAGLCVAPAVVSGFTLAGRLVPAGARTEAFAWLTGATALGQAVAVTVAGQLEDRLGTGSGFGVPMGGTVAALVVLLALRSRLRP